MKSLPHSPDIIGLFFAILNQFTSTSSFLSDGKLITIATTDNSHQLQGNDFVSKLYSGVVNWFGHLMSDIAGSSGAKTRGSGVVIPFFELFQLCHFGSFQVGKDKNTLAKLATKVFEEGYDARFGLSMGLPVLVCDLLIRLMWAIKRYFYHKCPLRECIPSKKHASFRMMLLIGNGVLCLGDATDATYASLKTNGGWIQFFLRFNLIAWYRFLYLVLREVTIRLGFSNAVHKQLESYIRINQHLSDHLEQLEKIDLLRYQKEVERYHHLATMLDSINSEESLTILLRAEYKSLGIELPYKGDFDDFMQDSNSVLQFK